MSKAIQSNRVSSPRYTMKISRLIVDKLGVKLYDKVSAVIAELVSNSYDADATRVTVEAPMGEYLATKQSGVLIDKNFSIVVEDNGHGMTPEQINDFYLVVGGERRKDKRRGEVSKKYHRKVMGRKGVGKLAPFGICETVEIVSSGGELIKGSASKGNGYQTAHLFMSREKIFEESEVDYLPEVGGLDGTIAPKAGTKIILRGFSHRSVPKIDQLERELSQRFGVTSNQWEVALVDSTKPQSSPDRKRTVGKLDVPLMDNTKILLPPSTSKEPRPEAIGPDGDTLPGIHAGFDLDGEFFPVTGWVAYSLKPYKDDLMAGVRIYCRGKIAAQTNIFNRGSGFTGEFDVRSYLVGEVQADWLDDEEDLIQTGVTRRPLF